MPVQKSAIAVAPVEIWIEIVDYLLSDPILFSTDPFYPGCNYQIALEEWQNERRLMEIAKQRAILRLVSRSWKYVVDLHNNRFYQAFIGDIVAHPLRIINPVRRLHVGLKDDSYDDPFHRALICSLNDHFQYSAILRQTLTSPESTTKILVLSAEIWAQMAQRTDPLSFKRSTQVIPGVKALEVRGSLKLTISVSSVCPNLTFLNIQLFNNAFSDTESNFPALTTLILASCATDFEGHINWAMPNLRHAELKDLTETLEYTLLRSFLYKPRPNLISLKARSMVNTLTLPDVIWEHLPKLEFLGISWLGDDNLDDYYPKPPPDWHPIHTVANAENEYAGYARNMLFHVIQNWKGLKVFSDIHRWEDLPRPIGYSCFAVKSKEPHDEFHPGNNCSRCVEDTAYLCYLKGLRYEDRLGRSLTDYLESPTTLLVDN